MVFTSFPWRGSIPVHDGRRPDFSRVPVHGSVCVCLCLVCGYHQFSMARVRSRPRRALASFFTCTRSARSRVRVRVRVRVCVCVPSTWFCPVFHGAGPFPSTTGVGQIFHVYPFSGPCKGPCVCVCLCLVCGFHQFSMARVHSRPRWASANFFTCTRLDRSRVRSAIDRIDTNGASGL